MASGSTGGGVDRGSEIRHQRVEDRLVIRIQIQVEQIMFHSKKTRIKRG